MLAGIIFIFAGCMWVFTSRLQREYAQGQAVLSLIFAVLNFLAGAALVLVELNP